MTAGGPGRIGGFFAVALICVVLAAQIGEAVGNVLVGVAAVAVLAAGAWALVAYMRSAAGAQIATMEATGSFEVDASLAFDSLPAPWSDTARETLPATAAFSTPALPVRLTVADGVLHIDKKTSRAVGRHPLAARVALSQVASVRVGPPRIGLIGSGLVIELIDGWTITADLQVRRERAEVVAAHLRSHVASAGAREQGPADEGVAVTTADPPARTPPQSAGAMAVLVLLPAIVAALGVGDGGGVALIGSLVVVTYAVWGTLRRAPTLGRRLAVVSSVSVGAFVVDTIVTGRVWLLVGAVLSGAIAVHLWRLPIPSRVAAPD